MSAGGGVRCVFLIIFITGYIPGTMSCAPILKESSRFI